LSAILTAAGSGLKKVVRTTVFLKNIADFAAMNEVYGRFFNVTPPARSTVEVSRLPKDVLVEIDVIALAYDCCRKDAFNISFALSRLGPLLLLTLGFITCAASRLAAWATGHQPHPAFRM